MSSLKYTLTIVAAVLVGSAPGQAESDSPLSDRLPSDRLASDRPLQDRDAGRTDFDMRAFRARLHNALGLSDEQVAELRLLRAQLQVHLRDTREEARAGNLTREERRARVQQIMNAHRQARNAALNPEQIALLDRAHRYLAERRLVSQHDRPHRRRHFARLAQALELTPEQGQEWRSLLERQRAAMQSLRESDERPTREDIRQLRLLHKEAFEAILTPEQLARFRDLEERRHQRRDPEGDDSGLDEFPVADEDPATSVGTKSWGEVKEESR